MFMTKLFLNIIIIIIIINFDYPGQYMLSHGSE